MNNLSVIQYSKDLTVDSREVAELIGKDHSHLLRDIRKYCNVISTNPKLDLLDFFIACDYEDNKGEIRPRFLITEKGCEVIGHKMQGEKGIMFTAEYVEAFHRVKDIINKQEPVKKLTALEQLQLQNEAILEVNEKVNKLENDMPLFKAECDELQALVKKKGTEALGGYHSPAYNDKPIRSAVYSDIQKQLRREFGVDKYAWIKHSQFALAKNIVESYELPFALSQEVNQCNNQISMGVDVI